MTGRWVDAETLAAALLNADTVYPYTEEDEVHMDAAAILAAIPPDPRLDALLAARADYLERVFGADVAWAQHPDPMTRDGWLRLAAAIPPDPRLDALLAAARKRRVIYERPVERGFSVVHEWDELHGLQEPCDFCDALAVFEEKV